MVECIVQALYASGASPGTPVSDNPVPAAVAVKALMALRGWQKVNSSTGDLIAQ